MTNELFRIEVLPKSSSFQRLVLATSYINPINYIPEVEKELIKSNFLEGQICFDLFLCNGQSFNRFIGGDFNRKILRETLEVTYLNLDTVKFANTIFFLNPSWIESNQILTPEDISFMKNCNLCV